MIVLADTTPMTMLFIGALAITIWILLMRSHRYFARQKQQESFSATTSGPIGEERGHHLDAPAAMARWEVQMHDTAREASAQLDSKMSALEALIADADRAATRLEAALEIGKGVGSLSPERPGGCFAQKTPDPFSAPQATEPEGGTGILPVQRPSTTEPPVAPAAETAAGGTAQRSAADRRQEIYTLADYGFPPAEIARRVGSPIGEVELILGLREKK